MTKWGTENEVILKKQCSSTFQFQLLFSIDASILLHHINSTSRDQYFLALCLCRCKVTGTLSVPGFLFLFHM